MRKAANLLQRRKWIQGLYATKNGEPCAPDGSAESYDALGAIRCCCPTAWDTIATVNAECLRLHKRTFVSWHDEPGRTKAEVVGFLRAIARSHR